MHLQVIFGPLYVVRKYKKMRVRNICFDVMECLVIILKIAQWVMGIVYIIASTNVD